MFGLAALAARYRARVCVNYNRRFLASAQKARALIAEDGGALSLRFEFSEFASRIAASPHPEAVKWNWLYANSTHVLDLAFFLGGFPARLKAHAEGRLDWHPAGARFAGHGVTECGALFSYIADWQSALRWPVEVYTARRALTLQPLEALRTRSANGFAEAPVDLDDALDRRFKPGLWRQAQAFLEGGAAAADLVDIAAHAPHRDGPFRAIRDGGRYEG